MGYFDAAIIARDHLEHHGILGQKWGIRRYQNKDGSLTAEGKKRAAEGTEGVRKVLEKGQSQVIRKRTIGKIKAGASVLGTVAGTTAAGAAIGSSVGPLGTLGGGYAGFLVGVPTSTAVSYFVKKHANVKANALEDQYRMLGQKMMEENKSIKLSDIDKALSNNKKKNAGAISIDDAHERLNRQAQIVNNINSQNQMQITNQMSQQAATQTIDAGLMTASLGASGGTDPYMFGLM